MNKARHHQDTDEMSEIKPKLISSIDLVLEQLSNDRLPSVDDINELQRLFDLYITSFHDQVIKKQRPQEEKQLTLKKEETGPEFTSAEVVADIRQNPKYLEILFFIGMKKIAEVNTVPFSSDKVKNLYRKGYLTLVNIKGKCSNNTEYYTLTDKGWSCFVRKNVAQQLRKALGMTALFIPAELSASQEKWTEETYQRAIMIQQYYGGLSESAEYMIFSYPENETYLFGCMMDKGNTVDYVCAALEGDHFNESVQDMLRKILTSSGVTSVTFIADKEVTATQMIKTLGAGEEENIKLGIAVWGGWNG